MTATSFTPGEAALAELIRRRTLAQDLLQQGRWTDQQAEARMKPWYAMALRAGCDLPPLREDLAARAADLARTWPDLSALRIDSLSRALLADELSPRAVWEPELLRARNAACDALAGNEPIGTPELTQAAALAALAAMAVFFGLPTWRPAAQREPAPTPERKAA